MNKEERRLINTERMRKYRKSQKYKDYISSDLYKETVFRYENSKKGKSSRKEYQAGEGGKEAQAKYRKTDKSKERTKKFLKTSKGRLYNTEKVKRYRISNPEKTIARSIAKKYLSPKVCEIKSCFENGERHHEDYKNPLEVRFLCRKHHMEHHWK